MPENLPGARLFSQAPVLENDWVLLRPLESADLAHLVHFAENEPEIWRYSLAQIQSATQLETYIQQAVENRKQEKEMPFIVFDKKKGKYAGSTRFYDIQLAWKTLQLGFTWYGKEFQGGYVNKNCKLLLLQYAFETLGMERVEFRADNRNERSKRAMISIGCIEEGVLRSHLPTVEGGRRDSIVLSILKTEWENGVKASLEQKLRELNPA